MAAAAEPPLVCLESKGGSPEVNRNGQERVHVAENFGNDHLKNREDTLNHQTSSKKSRGKKRQGRRKDRASSNGIHELDDKVETKFVESKTTTKESKRTCQSDNHLNHQSHNHVISEPLNALTQMVEKLGVQDGIAPQMEHSHTVVDVPSDAACQDGDIDESLTDAKCNSDDDEDDADLELPSSLSDFVLGYHEDYHYALTKLPPNDEDIDTIPLDDSNSCVRLVPYESELQMPDIIRLITKDLSEPYSIYTYRYFIHNWPNLCFLAMHGSTCVGAIVCKLDVHKKMVRRGYIAMLAVDEEYRKRKLGSSLVKKAIRAMVRGECDEVVLETEITNKPALRLYQNLGFVRDKRLFRYYLNGVDALRLKLWLQ
ncbi:N-alpha-acetyltransferase 30-like [Lytechinus pictus]|uniref:N-alpha-acetyltransferase 30-like n=1 Tax=Lytechinus pictus TaxID=7653 RepID=UPI00240E67B8|nr:N-alpha-acetyltransferase 30-like [Lytechinus pictus]